MAIVIRREEMAVGRVSDDPHVDLVALANVLIDDSRPAAVVEVLDGTPSLSAPVACSDTCTCCRDTAQLAFHVPAFILCGLVSLHSRKLSGMITVSTSNLLMLGHQDRANRLFILTRLVEVHEFNGH